MDLRKLEKQLIKYFKDMNISADSRQVEENGVKHCEVVSAVTINDLDGEQVQIRCLAYENGTSQVTFNFGEANFDAELFEMFDRFNVGNFSLKACSEYGEIRLYNQCFLQSPDDFILNFNMTLTMFLKDETLELIKPMLGHIKRG